MTSLDQILSEFIDEWSAGKRPDAEAYLARAPEADRDELADLLHSYLEWAPAPRYEAKTMKAIAAEPGVRAAAALVESRSGLWPALLPYLRKRARLTRDKVVAGICEGLGLSGREPAVKAYYHEMEAGTLDAGGVSRKVIGALASVLSVSESEIEDAGDFEGLAGPEAGWAFMRMPEPGSHVAASRPMRADRMADLDMAEAAGGPPAFDEAERFDEVDRLFRGGR